MIHLQLQNMSEPEERANSCIDVDDETRAQWQLTNDDKNASDSQQEIGTSRNSKILIYKLSKQVILVGLSFGMVSIMMLQIQNKIQNTNNFSQAVNKTI